MKKFGIETVLGFVCLILLAGVIAYYELGNKKYEAEIRTLNMRLALAIEHPDTFIIRDSIPVWKEKVVEVDKTDYKKQLADKELIKELGLKVSQLESENRTLLNTRDTVVLEPVNDSVLSYRDNWVTFKYLMNERVLGYSVRDSLSAFVSREYKHRFLWWRWGTKGYNVSIVSHNPKCKVEYNKYIKIK